MKAKKVVKRLAKIEALISGVTDRYSDCTVQIREALQDAKAAFTRVKKAVNSQVSAERGKGAGTKRKKVAARRAVKTPTAKVVKKGAPIKRAVKNAVAKRKAPASVGVPVQTPTAHVA